MNTVRLEFDHVGIPSTDVQPDATFFEDTRADDSYAEALSVLPKVGQRLRSSVNSCRRPSRSRSSSAGPIS